MQFFIFVTNHISVNFLPQKPRFVLNVVHTPCCVLWMCRNCGWTNNLTEKMSTFWSRSTYYVRHLPNKGTVLKNATWNQRPHFCTALSPYKMTSIKRKHIKQAFWWVWGLLGCENFSVARYRKNKFFALNGINIQNRY